MDDRDREREWVRLMLELAATNRDAYRVLRAEAWKSVIRGHGEKTPCQLAAWLRAAS